MGHKFCSFIGRKSRQMWQYWTFIFHHSCTDTTTLSLVQDFTVGQTVTIEWDRERTRDAHAPKTYIKDIMDITRWKGEFLSVEDATLPPWILDLIG